MGIDTKGFIATPCKDVFFIVGLVENALNALIKPHVPHPIFGRRAKEPAEPKVNIETVTTARYIDVTVKVDPPVEEELPAYKLVKLEMTPSSQMVRFHFSYAGEHRTLWMFFDTDCDRKQYSPTSISMSLGCWGQSDLFMQTALRALSPLGDTYFDHNDCDDIEFAKMDDAPHTFISACQARYEVAYASTLEKWKQLYDAGLLRKGSFEEVLGMSEATYQEIQDASYEQGQAKLEALGAVPAKAQRPAAYE